MKTKILSLIFIATVMLMSCEKETEEEMAPPAPTPVETTTTIYLLDKYTSDNGDFDQSIEYTYTDDTLLTSAVKVIGETATHYVLEYDTEGRITKVFENDVISAMYSYVDGKINYSYYYHGELTYKHIFELNSNNKLIKYTTEGSEYYFTYTWDGDNMKTRSYYNADGIISTTTYSHDPTILSAEYNKYSIIAGHPSYSSKNATTQTVSDSDNEPMVYTLTANENNYIHTAESNNALGANIQTYTYKAVKIPN